jgi:hypothetical protein
MHKHLRHAHLLRNLQQRHQVVDVRVHAAVRHEPQEVQPAVALLRALARRAHVGHAAELAALDGRVDAHDVLPHDAAGADVQVPDLAVAHEALRQADRRRRGRDRRVPAAGPRALVAK